MKTHSTLLGLVTATFLLSGGTAKATVPSTSWFVRWVGPVYTSVGRDLNGTTLNGVVLDGRYVERVVLNSATMNGVSRASTQLNETRFQGLGGLYGNGQSGSVEFLAILDDGNPVTLRIEAAWRHPEPGHHDVTLYEVTYQTSAGWAPLCGLDADGDPVPAIPLQGRWSYEEGIPGGGDRIDDPDAFTFACEGRVLAKCVLAGYKPWREMKLCAPGQGCHKVSLAGHHQACTRALRADYCGDGTSYTEDGVDINMYDNFDIRTDSLGWSAEAEWSADGALCAVAERIADAAPACFDQLYAAGCGSDSYPATGPVLLVTEHLPTN